MLLVRELPPWIYLRLLEMYDNALLYQLIWFWPFSFISIFLLLSNCNLENLPVVFNDVLHL